MSLPAPKRTKRDLEVLLAQITIPNRCLRLLEKGDSFLVQLEYDEPDADKPGSLPVLQRSRKWTISPFATDTEVVETVWKAAKVSWEHQLAESFRFEGLPIYSPHLHLQARKEICKLRWFDIETIKEEWESQEPEEWITAFVPRLEKALKIAIREERLAEVVRHVLETVEEEDQRGEPMIGADPIGTVNWLLELRPRLQEALREDA